MDLLSARSLLCGSAVLALLLAGFTAFGQQRTVPAYSIPKPAAKDNSAPPKSPSFKDVTLELGLLFSHKQEAGEISEIKDAVGPGVCLGDINGDYLDDVVFVTGGGSRRTYGGKAWWLSHRSVEIYINENGVLRNRTDQYGLTLDHPTMGCLLTDLNNDGFSDLVITSYSGTILFQNLDGGRFKKDEVFSQLALNEWSTCTISLDANNDGLADLYICHYLRHRTNQKTFEAASGFGSGLQSRFDPKLYDGVANQLLINKGGFIFEDGTKDYFPSVDQDRSLAALYRDLNHDGRADLLVLNDAGSPGRLYLASSAGVFSEDPQYRTPLKLVSSHYASLDDDGRVLLTRASGLGLTYLEDPRHTGDYEDVGWKAGLNATSALPYTHWGAVMADLNLDGEDDIYLATGLRTPDSYATRRTGAQQDQLYLKSEKGFTTSDIPPSRNHSARSVGTSDFNLDGRPDLIVVNNNAPATVLLNTSVQQGHWVGIKSIQQAVVTLTQQSWQRTLPVGDSPLFLGSQNTFKIVYLQSAEPIEISLAPSMGPTGKRTTGVLEPGRHYVFDGQRFKPVLLKSPPQDDDIAALAPFLQKAWFHRSVQQSRSDPTVIAGIRSAIATSGAPSDYKRQILSGPVHIHLLSLYLEWMNDTDLHIREMAWKAITKLESDVSVDYLLPQLESEDVGFVCSLSETFATWYYKEEAVIKTKYLAVPYFIRLLQHPDPKIVACSARVVGLSEHQTSQSALVKAYSSTNDVVSKRLIVEAIGNVRQAGAIPFLERLFSTEHDAETLVLGAIALNRLSAQQGDAQLRSSLRSDRLSDRQKIEVAATTQAPWFSLHFHSDVVEDIQKWLKSSVVKEASSENELSFLAQLIIGDLSGRTSSHEALSWSLRSDDPSLYSLGAQLIERAAKSKEDLYLHLLSLNEFKKLPLHVQSMALGSATKEHLLNHEPQGYLIANMVAGLSSLSSSLQSTLIERIASTDGAFLPVYPTDCRTYPLQPDSLLSQERAPNWLLSALFLPTIAETRSQADASQWLGSELAALSMDGQSKLFVCLNQLQLTDLTSRKINVSILGLPDRFDSAKWMWLTTASRRDVILSSAIRQRFQKDDAFVRYFVDKTDIARLDADLVKLLTRGTRAPDIALFGKWMEESLKTGTETNEKQ